MRFSILFFIIYLIVFNSTAQTGNDWVDAKVYTYISGGSWCWFQDERAVIDTAKNKLVIGATNMQANTLVAIFDLESKTKDSEKKFNSLGSGKQDDHNAPGILIGPDGSYIAMWAQHYDQYNTHYSIYKNGSWSAEKTFNWNNIPGGTDYTIAYNNVYYLSKEKRMFDFSRANDRAPNFLYSDDNGSTWKFGGQLTTNKSNTYNKGYYKYWSNGVDRIDMAFTEQHPRDDTTSIYHGYFMGGKTYNSFGEVADDDVYTKDSIPTFGAFTKVFAHNTKVDGVTMGRCWQSDLCRYDDSTIAILFFARANDDTLDHRNFYARFDGKKWNVTYLGKAGKGIYASEQDYTGLGALNPDDAGRIYLCTRYNPADDKEQPSNKRELWRGTTEDFGATWTWEKVTANSTKDNFRPIIPKWTPGKEALLWFKGDYIKAQDVRTDVIGTFYEYEYNPPVAIKEQRTFQKDFRTNFTSRVSSGHILFRYRTSDQTTVSLDIFSLSGKKVASLANALQNAATYNLTWNTANTPSGTYLVRISAGSRSFLKRVTVQ